MSTIPLLQTPQEAKLAIAERAARLRLQANITQAHLAQCVDVSLGTIKRFEKSGDVQLDTLLRILLVLNRLSEADALFRFDDKPSSLFTKPSPKRQRARRPSK